MNRCLICNEFRELLREFNSLDANLERLVAAPAADSVCRRRRSRSFVAGRYQHCESYVDDRWAGRSTNFSDGAVVDRADVGLVCPALARRRPGAPGDESGAR